MKKLFLHKKENKKIILSNTYVLLDEEDFDIVACYKWYIMRLYHCKTEILYARRYEGSPRKGNHKAILIHRQILGAINREQKVDHIDGNGLNNQKSNIRIVTHSENMSNRKVSQKKDIKYLGVYLNKENKTYRVCLKKNSKCYYKSGFKSPEEAAKAYNELIIKYNPIFGKQNTIIDA